jgi:hypothetical protein
VIPVVVKLGSGEGERGFWEMGIVVVVVKGF